MDSAAGNAARSSVLVVSASERGTLSVVGQDRSSWLNGIVTCDVAQVAPGRGALGLILTRAGKVMSDLFLVASAEKVFVSVAPGKHGELREYLDKMLVMEDAELADESEAAEWLTLHGPAAEGAAAAAAARVGGASGRIDWTGLGGAALVVDRERVEAALAAIREHSPGAALASPEDWTLLRLERGVSSYGVDYGAEDNPHEASLDQTAVSWNKGCYLGQEVVCMQGMRGKVKRRLVSLSIEAGPGVAAPAPVERADDGAPVGEVTSSTFSERLGAVVALARIHGAALEAGAPLRVAGASARVVERPEP